jgi:hypothetical protein
MTQFDHRNQWPQSKYKVKHLATFLQLPPLLHSHSCQHQNYEAHVLSLQEVLVVKQKRWMFQKHLRMRGACSEYHGCFTFQDGRKTFLPSSYHFTLAQNHPQGSSPSCNHNFQEASNTDFNSYLHNHLILLYCWQQERYDSKHFICATLPRNSTTTLWS